LSNSLSFAKCFDSVKVSIGVFRNSICPNADAPRRNDSSSRQRPFAVLPKFVIPFDSRVLEEIYFKELRPFLGVPERENLTLRLWIEMIEETRNQK